MKYMRNKMIYNKVGETLDWKQQLGKAAETWSEVTLTITISE